MSKVIAIDDVAGLIKPGHQLALGGGPVFQNPVGLVKAVIKAGIGELRLVVAPTGGLAADMLIAAGLVTEVETSQLNLGEYGSAPHFRRSVEEGRLTVRENSCPALLDGLLAGAKGLPFMPVRGLFETDYLSVRPDFKVIENPYDGEPIVVVPAINPDVALIHAAKADAFGNFITDPNEDDPLLVKASKRVILSVEEIVSPEDLLRDGSGVRVPGIYVDHIVVIPNGAYPTSCFGKYPRDGEKIRAYREAALEQERYADFVAAL